MRHISFLLLLALAPVVAFADTTGALNGRVVDALTQKPLANVQVAAASPSEQRMAFTNARGDFVMLNLSPETYTVSFILSDYEPSVFFALEIPAGNEIHVKVALQPPLRTIDGGVRLSYPTVHPDITADIYELYGWAPQYAAPASAFGLLPFVPGVTIGVAPRAIR